MTPDDVRAWAVAFLLTQLVEIPIYLLFQRRTGRPVAERAAIAFAASAVTHPLLWFASPVVIDPSASFVTFLAWVEAFAIAVEAAWLSAFRVPRPLLASAIANAASVGAGLVVRRLL